MPKNGWLVVERPCFLPRPSVDARPLRNIQSPVTARCHVCTKSGCKLCHCFRPGTGNCLSSAQCRHLSQQSDGQEPPLALLRNASAPNFLLHMSIVKWTCIMCYRNQLERGRLFDRILSLNLSVSMMLKRKALLNFPSLFSSPPNLKLYNKCHFYTTSSVKMHTF